MSVRLNPVRLVFDFYRKYFKKATTPI